MKPFVLAVLLLFCVACDEGDPVVRTVNTGKPVLKQVNEHCTHYDYCYNCGLDYHGKYSCGFSFSHSCDGRQDSQYLIQPKTRFYKSGRMEYFEDESFVRALTSCS